MLFIENSEPYPIFMVCYLCDFFFFFFFFLFLFFFFLMQDEVRFHKEGDAAENDKGAENLAAAMKAVYSDPGSNRSNTVAGEN